MLKQFFVSEKGATAIEYGLIAALIAVAVIAVITTLGTDLQGVFGSDVSAVVQQAAPVASQVPAPVAPDMAAPVAPATTPAP